MGKAEVPCPPFQPFVMTCYARLCNHINDIPNRIWTPSPRFVKTKRGLGLFILGQRLQETMQQNATEAALRTFRRERCGLRIRC